MEDYMQYLRTMFSVLLSFCIISGVFAGPEGVLKTIPTDQYPGGLTWDGQNLWLGYVSSSLKTIDKIDTADGTILNSIPEPRPEAQAEIRGLAWDGSFLWVYRYRFGSSTPETWDYIYKMDTTGTVLDSIRSPFEDYCGGLAFGNGKLWVSQYYSSNAAFNNVIHEVDTSSGAVLNSFPTVGEQPMGVAFDGQYVWCAEDTGYGATRQEIYEYDPSSGTATGGVIRNPDDAPRDLTWDGKSFWLVGYYSRLIYKIAPAGGTPAIQLSVNSLNFGLVAIGDTSVQSLTIHNAGDATLNVGSVEFDTSVYFTEVNSFPLQIDPGSNYVLPVSFAPEDAGAVSGQLTIYSDDPLNPVETVSLNGQGQYVEPTIWVSDTTHDFGNVWIPVEGKSQWRMKIANTGNQDLEIVDLILNDPIFTLGGFSDFPITIVPNDTFMLSVYFQPVDTTTYLDSLIIASTDPANPYLYISLTGTGVLDDYQTGYSFWNYTVPDNPDAGSYQEYEVDGLKTINDINGDGVDEVVIATENYWILCLDGNGSGVTDTLWSFSTYISNSSAGSIGANADYGVQDAIQVASDLNGDGQNDVVIATGGGNEHVYAIDGTNGEMLWTFGTDDPNSYGMGDFEAVDVQRDFNDDGIPDVLAIADGNSSSTGYKSAYLFDGSSGTTIWTYPYPGPNPSFGKTIISVEDVTGDNKPDAVIAVGNNETTGLKTYCIDGASGFVVWDQDAINYEPKEIVELPLSGESPDVIVGEYFSTIRRLDGETGVEVWRVDLGVLSGIIQMQRITDIDDDGVDDVLIASFASGATCLSGATGSNIWTHPMPYQFAIATVPDLDGDGYEDVLVGTGNTSPIYGDFYCLSGKQDSVLFHETFSGDKVYTVQASDGYS
jgi:outer membrane protein assembly factor BamB